MQDQARTSAPDRLGNEGLQKRADDELRIVLADGFLHRGGGVHHRDLDLGPELGQGDPGALTRAVVRRDQEQNPQCAVALTSSGRGARSLELMNG